MCENWKQECKKGFLAPDQVSKELLRRNNQICNNLQHIRYLSLSLSLTNVLSLPLFLHFTPIYLCINVSIYLSIYLFNINVSIYVSMYLSMYQCIYLCINLFINVSIYVSMYLSIVASSFSHTSAAYLPTKH